MGLQPIEVEGTLHADGTLVLDEKPNVPPGRVRVALSPVAGATPPEDGFIARMQRIWAEQAARGHVGRTREEIDAEINALRDEAEQEMREAEQLHEECQRARDQHARDQGSGR